MTDTYIHGTDPEEQDRLARMNELINAACLREVRCAGARRILDVGSGLGQFARTMAREAGAGAVVVGVEADERQRGEALRLADAAGESELVSFRAGRAEALPLRDDEVGTFELVHARFLLEHHRDPQAVVGEMARAAAPGGRIVLLDDDHDVLRLHPDAPATVASWRAFIRSYERIGCDPFVGRRLPSLLAAAGARPRRVAAVPYGACAGQPEFRALAENLVRVVLSARPTLLEHGLANDRDLAAMQREMADWVRRPDAVLWYSICFAEGVVD